MRITRQEFCSHAGRGADSRSGFTDEAAMPDIVLEVMAQAVDFEIIAPDPFWMVTLPICAQSLGWLACMGLDWPEEAGGGADRRRETPSRP